MNNSSIFFIEPTGNNYDFDQFPKDLYVDTCFWNKAISINSGKTHYFRDFITSAIDNGTTLYTSGLVTNEIMHITKKALIAEQMNKYDFKMPYNHNGEIDYKRLFEILKEYDPNIVSEIDSKIHSILNGIDKLAVSLDFENNQEFQMEALKVVELSDYIIGSIDAQHIALAHMYEINSIATADGDYCCLDNANLFVPSSEKYKIGRLSRKNVLLPYDNNIY